MESIWNILGGIFAGVVLALGFGYLALKALEPKSDEKSKEKAPVGSEEEKDWSWVKHPAAVIAYGLIVFNLISRAIPWWWDILTYTWYGFMIFNVGLWTVIYLRIIKSKEVTGKSNKESNPASGLATFVTLVLIAWLITTTWYYFQQGDLTSEEYREKVVVEKAMRKALAKEPVLAIVARCRPAKEFNTAEKVEAASKLYKEKGLLPWKENMGCWQSMITRDMLPVRLAVVEAPTNGWSQVVKIPQIVGGFFADWPSASINLEIMPDGDESKKQPRGKASFSTSFGHIQFHSTGSKPEKVEVVVRQ